MVKQGMREQIPSMEDYLEMIAMLREGEGDEQVSNYHFSKETIREK